MDFFNFFGSALGTLVQGLFVLVTSSWSEWNPLGGLHADWSMIEGLNYYLPLSEMSQLMIALMALGLPMMSLTLLSWYSIGVLRGGAPRA